MKRLGGKKALVLNETTCALTFARLFEYSDYIVAVETFQLWLRSSRRCCNKLDIICVHTLRFGLRYLERASDTALGNLAGRSTRMWGCDIPTAGTDVAGAGSSHLRGRPLLSESVSEVLKSSARVSRLSAR